MFALLRRKNHFFRFNVFIFFSSKLWLRFSPNLPLAPVGNWMTCITENKDIKLRGFSFFFYFYKRFLKWRNRHSWKTVVAMNHTGGHNNILWSRLHFVMKWKFFSTSTVKSESFVHCRDVSIENKRITFKIFVFINSPRNWNWQKEKTWIFDTKKWKFFQHVHRCLTMCLCVWLIPELIISTGVEESLNAPPRTS
jgi:hypothetical protein